MNIEVVKNPLSQISQDFGNLYGIVALPELGKKASPVFQKFVLTRLYDQLKFDFGKTDVKTVREEREKLRELLLSMRILEVGKRSGFSSQFGSSDYVEDLFFLNNVMKEYSRSKDNQINGQYDLIFMTDSLLPSRITLYEILQVIEDKRVEKKEKSYWGTDSDAYNLRNRVQRLSAEFSIARREGLLPTSLPLGIDMLDRIKKFQGSCELANGLADLFDIDYQKLLVNRHLIKGGVLIDYEGCSPVSDGLKLFDEYKYQVSWGQASLEEKRMIFLKKFDKIKL